MRILDDYKIYIPKYGSLIGIAFILNLIYSAWSNLSVYTLESIIRVSIFSAILYIGSVWGKMDFRNLGRD